MSCRILDADSSCVVHTSNVIQRVYYTRTICIQDSAWHYSCVLHKNYLHPRFCMTLLVCTTQELSKSKILYDITRVYYTGTIYIQDSVWHYSCILHKNYLHARFCMTLLVYTTREQSTSKILYDITRVYYTRTIYIQDSVWHYSCILHENYLHSRFCMTWLVYTTQELVMSYRILDVDSSCVVHTSNVIENLGCR
jgi:hypothetical protein